MTNSNILPSSSVILLFRVTKNIPGPDLFSQITCNLIQTPKKPPTGPKNAYS